MMTKDNEPIYKKANGTYVVIHNGTTDWCGFPPHDPNANHPHDEVSAYILAHPESLIPEPVPPPPTEAELAAREVAAAHAYLTSTDWIIAKIGETQMQGEPIAALLTKYAGELGKRAESRLVINEKE